LDEVTTSQSIFFDTKLRGQANYRPAQEERSQKSKPRAARTSPYTVRTDDASKVRFFVTVGEEPEIEVGPV
jgi:hypothetical protein